MIFFVLNLDDPESDKSGRGKASRKPLDLDAPVEDKPKTGKRDGKLEIVRDTDSTYRKKPPVIDRVRERKRRRVLTSILVVSTCAALLVIGLFLLRRPPTFNDAKDAPLPITSAPTPTGITVPGATRGPAAVIPNARPDPLSTLPNLNQDTERSRDSTAGGIH